MSFLTLETTAVVAGAEKINSTTTDAMYVPVFSLIAIK